jgi:two-component system, NtrC family, sensor histidine kinase AtoS
MKRIAKEKKINLYHEEKHHELVVDRDQLRQILLNVIINGMNAMPSGGELSISSKQKGNEVVILISDTGIGMEESVIGKIFDPFFTTRSKGTGLGLSVVHQLVVQNKGEIDVSSQKGKGTTFSIAFRLERGSEINGS